MKDSFQKTLAALAAVVVFTGGGAALVNGMSSLADYKVNAVLVDKQNVASAAKAAAEADTSVFDAAVTGVKKLGKVLQ
jgi:hypothetical protein